MNRTEECIEAQVALIKKEGERIQRGNEKKEKDILHSLPITIEERSKREHEVEEQRRFTDMPGVFSVTRNGDGYITEIRKQVEDVVIEHVYTRDSDNYIIGMLSRLKKETKA